MDASETFNPDYKIHPGETLKEMLSAKGLTVDDFPKHTKRDTQKVIVGSGSITPELAKELAQIFNVSESFWLKLQRNYDNFKTK